MKKEPKYQWNYRVCTWVDYEYAEEGEAERLYGIRLVHYVDKVPKSAADGNHTLNDSVSLEELKEGHKQMGIALQKPILDLDNGLEEFDPAQAEEVI